MLVRSWFDELIHFLLAALRNGGGTTGLFHPTPQPSNSWLGTFCESQDSAFCFSRVLSLTRFCPQLSSSLFSLALFRFGYYVTHNSVTWNETRPLCDMKYKAFAWICKWQHNNKLTWNSTKVGTLWTVSTNCSLDRSRCLYVIQSDLAEPKNKKITSASHTPTKSNEWIWFCALPSYVISVQPGLIDRNKRGLLLACKIKSNYVMVRQLFSYEGWIALFT